MATKIKVYFDNYPTGFTANSIGVFRNIEPWLEFAGTNIHVEIKGDILEVVNYVQGTATRNVLFGCPIRIVRYWVLE